MSDNRQADKPTVSLDYQKRKDKLLDIQYKPLRYKYNSIMDIHCRHKEKVRDIWIAISCTLVSIVFLYILNSYLA